VNSSTRRSITQQHGSEIVAEGASHNFVVDRLVPRLEENQSIMPSSIYDDRLFKATGGYLISAVQAGRALTTTSILCSGKERLLAELYTNE